ncbi:hypothetical protein Q4E93_00335 [Flavitalea sp. BT771]|uniref:hypothetical protein n=1 Tax=Flavitalea sp. BT771 TaxID=3063329 RepID=UPI0026E1E9F0|nr:hypothetical protein [Flavitalea sp. BT771]MDO6429011.1 hypothetical protein [Flavitalea sp. BT771]MDV6218861.1 hypothetical protein [Flavitalea sp. BT771]
MKEEIVHSALDNLKKAAPVRAAWKATNNKEMDGRLEIHMMNRKVVLQTIVIKEVGDDQLSQIYKLAYKHAAFIVIARKISPKVKEILRQIYQPYLEESGDIFLYQKNACLLIDRQSDAPHSLPASIPEIKSSLPLSLKEKV